MAKKLLSLKHLAIVFMIIFCGLGSSVSAQVYHILGSGTGSNGSTGYPCPIGNYYYGDKEQYFVTSGELLAIGILPGSTISSIGFNVVTLNSCPSLNNYQIKVFTTSSTNPLTSSWVTTGEVASSTTMTLSPTLGWNQITLTAPFVWSGTENLVIQVCMQNASWTSSGNASVQWTNSGLSSSTAWTRYYRADATGVCANTSYTEISYTTRPNIRFGATPPVSGNCTTDPWNAGTATAPSSICPTTPFTVLETGGSYMTGLTRQWQKSTDGGTVWTNISGATTSAYSEASGVSVSTMYRLVLTCSGTGITDTTNEVTVAMSPAYDCMCIPDATYTGINYTTYVEMTGGLTDLFKTSGDAVTSTGYSDFTSTDTVSAIHGMTIDFTVNTYISGSNCNLGIWVDWNQNGVFESSEMEYLYLTSGGAKTFTGSFIVPPTALAGNTRMRVRSVYYYSSYYTYSDVPPCGTVDWGEAEDYIFQVIPPEPCSGIPVGGTASATPSMSSPSTTFNLTSAGASYAIDMEYQWQISDDGLTGWTDIVGASTLLYTATAPPILDVTTYYRLKMTCPTSGEVSYSTVTSHTTVLTYCTPVSGTSSTNNYIVYVSLSGGTSTTNSTGYDNYSNYMPTHNINAVQGTTVDFTVQNQAGSSNSYCYIWADWNHDGDFDDAGEVAYSLITGGGFAGTLTGSFTIPYTAVPGMTRIRIRTDWYSAVPSGYPAMTPCGSTAWGEVEDYGIMVIESVPCSGEPEGGTAVASPSVGSPGSTFTLNASGYTLASGLEFQWQSSEDGVSWSDIPGATTTSFDATAVGTFTLTYYRLKVTCTTTGDVAYSSVTTYQTIPIYDVCTSHIANNGANSIIFHVQNTNSYPVNVNEIKAWPGSSSASVASGTYSFKLLYNPTAIYSSGASWTAGPVGEGVGGWISAGTNSATFTSIAEPQTAISGMEIIIPAGATYTFCLTQNTGTLGYMTLTSGAGVNTYTEGGVSIKTGDNISWGGGSFYSSSGTPVNYPRGFVGCIVFNIPCSSPTALTLVDNTITTATVSWTEPGTLPDEGYNIYITTTPTEPDPALVTPAASLPLGTTDYTFTGLSAGTTYYVWITGDCGDGAFGAMTGPLTFTTAPACNPPASVGFSTITHNSAYAAWPAPVPAPTEGYEYYYSDDPTPPSSGTTPMGTATLTFASLTDLASATTYYVWVRAVCYEDEPSPWSVMGTFTTLPGCLTPSGLSASATSWSTADVSWTAVVPAPSGGYDYYYSTDATAPTSGTTPSGSTTSTSVSLTGLTGSTTYYVWVRSDCGSPLGESGWSIVPIEFVTPLQNDDAAGAFEITVGGGCVSPYTNVTASVATDEPFPSCIGTDGYGVVWFKFTAPSSGQVKISNDYAVGGTPMGDSKIGLFEVGDVADYSTFTIVACDDDNGFVSPGKSILYAADLTPGMDYYVAVSAKTSGDEGDFCITIEEMDDSHLSALDDCTPTTPLVNMNEDYYGWLSIVDGSGNLIALVRPNAFAGAGTFSLDASQYIEGGSVRLDSLGTPYMDRNITINNTGNTITDADVRFYFLDSELADLDGVTLGTVGVSKYSPSSTCLDAYPTGIMPEYLTQEASGAIGTMRWVEVNVTGFSTFFLHGGAGPLDVNLGQLTAENKGAINQLFWSSVSEKTKELTYIIERSDDGRAFSEIGSTAAKGKASNYSFTDITPVDGINYYRVKAVDATNRTLYTNVAIAEVVVSNILTAYPNPTKDVVNVSIHKLGTNAKLSVTDVHGRVLQEIELGTQTHVQVNLEAYAQGTYYIKYSDDATSQTFKVNKQ